MEQIYALFVSCLFVPAFVAAQSSLGVPLLGQCGGIGYTGPTQCAQPKVVIECKALSTRRMQVHRLDYVTEWYTGPEPTKWPLVQMPTPTLAPTSTFIGTTKPTPSSSSQRCPATVCPKTCSSPAGSFSQSSTPATCSTPLRTLLDPTAKPTWPWTSRYYNTAFLEAENVVHWHQETQPADIGTTWRKRIAMPEVNPELTNAFKSSFRFLGLAQEPKLSAP
ncbi:hypothetical protein BKA70DRAFT_1287024 [Coprinopsis sp. MPI-PUGE-AT-0042]|nr:hypothetical protein BKA70DRAFT_1287024 [Coprinopsis sp. MPI-PUGE-AT-0042]